MRSDYTYSIIPTAYQAETPLIYWYNNSHTVRVGFVMSLKSNPFTALFRVMIP